MKDVPVLINPYFQEFATGSCSDKNLISIQEVHDNSITICMSYLLVGVAVPMRTILNRIGNISYQIASCQRMLPTVFPVCSYLPLICLETIIETYEMRWDSVLIYP